MEMLAAVGCLAVFLRRRVHLTMEMLAAVVLLSLHIAPNPVLPVGVHSVIRCSPLGLTVSKRIVVIRAYVIGVELAISPSPPMGCYSSHSRA